MSLKLRVKLTVSLAGGKQKAAPILETQVVSFNPLILIEEVKNSPPIGGVKKEAPVPTKNKLSVEQIPIFSKENKFCLKF